MDKVSIDVNGVLGVAQNINNCIYILEKKQWEMQRMLNTVDPRVLNRHNIRGRITAVIKELSREQDKLRQIQSVLRLAANSYAQAENKVGAMHGDLQNKLSSLTRSLKFHNLQSGIGTAVPKTAVRNTNAVAATSAAGGTKAWWQNLWGSVKGGFETGARVIEGDIEAAWADAIFGLGILWNNAALLTDEIGLEAQIFGKNAEKFLPYESKNVGTQAAEFLTVNAAFFSNPQRDLAELEDDIKGRSATRVAAKLVLDNPWEADITQSGAADGFLKFFNFSKGEDNAYHTDQPVCWQEGFGYSDFDDDVFKAATSMNDIKVSFDVDKSDADKSDVDKKEYTVWIWKGDYLNLGAGGEVGIYDSKKICLQPGAVEASNDHMLKMTLNGTVNGETVFDYKPGQPIWWANGFNPEYQNVDEKNIILSGTIDFSDHEDMYKPFRKECEKEVDKKKGITWEYDDINYTAKFYWVSPQKEE